jgi:hypothetical protein
VARSQPAGDIVAVTTLVPESATTCGGDSVYEHGGGPGDAPATAAVAANANAPAAVRTISARIIPGW